MLYLQKKCLDTSTFNTSDRARFLYTETLRIADTSTHKSWTKIKIFINIPFFIQAEISLYNSRNIQFYNVMYACNLQYIIMLEIRFWLWFIQIKRWPIKLKVMAENCILIWILVKGWYEKFIRIWIQSINEIYKMMSHYTLWVKISIYRNMYTHNVLSMYTSIFIIYLLFSLPMPIKSIVDHFVIYLKIDWL